MKSVNTFLQICQSLYTSSGTLRFWEEPKFPPLRLPGLRYSCPKPNRSASLDPNCFLRSTVTLVELLKRHNHERYDCPPCNDGCILWWKTMHSEKSTVQLLFCYLIVGKATMAPKQQQSNPRHSARQEAISTTAKQSQS